MARTITFNYNGDLAPLGDDPLLLSKDYVMTITSQTGISNPIASSESFILRLTNPCDRPTITPPESLIGQPVLEYMIYLDPRSLNFEPFVVEPSFCALSYSYSLNEKEVEPIVSYFDETSRRITFDYNSLIVPLDFDESRSSQEFIVTIEARAGISEEIKSESTFILTLINPCVDGQTIEAPNTIVQNGVFEYSITQGPT